MPKASKLFTCPNCGHNQIDEVVRNTPVYHRVLKIETDFPRNLTFGEAFFNPAYDSQAVFTYLCAECKTQIPDIKNRDELMDFLLSGKGKA